MLARTGRRVAPSSRDVARNALSGLAATLAGFAVMDRDATVGLMLFGGGILWMVLSVADVEEDTL